MLGVIRASQAASERRRSRVRRPIGRAVAVGGLLVVLAGCSIGSGEVKTETRQTGDFSRIEATAGIGVIVQIGPAQPLEVRAQANILPVIATDVEDGTLRIHSTSAYTSTEPVEVRVVTPSLDGISMSGGSQGSVTGLQAEALDIEVNGGGGVTAKGTVSKLNLAVNGGGRTGFDDLVARSVALDLSGGATATVHASEQVNGTASGGSTVTVLGNPQVNVQTSGGSSVARG
jgi:hypothetical protein